VYSHAGSRANSQLHKKHNTQIHKQTTIQHNYTSNRHKERTQAEANLAPGSNILMEFCRFIIIIIIIIKWMLELKCLYSKIK
jgi:hypothetical protein